MTARQVITCMGDSLIDFLPFEEGGELAGFRLFPAGSIFNVAVGLARLGQPVAFAGAISTDYFGERILARLTAEGIEERFISRSAAPTTLAFVARQAGEPVFLFYGEGTADTRLTLTDLPDAFFAETRMLHIGSTSLLRGSTPDAIESAAQRLKGHALLSLDPNVRPSLVADEGAYRERLNRLFALADIVKVSAEDLRWLDDTTTPEAFADRLVEGGAALVAITDGARGAFAVTAAGARVAVPAFPVEVRDTVGAGDAFNAGLLAACVERGVTTRAEVAAMSEAALLEALRLASAAAALTCGRAGADPPRRSEVERLLG